ncbi:hypothetical protein BT96DRAFT_968820 [Gymnopus androsaceus JB14]|uniref:Uncharacterized protein n=1 Tax=Gymnopus androsaceus JB14 TaxID=1447944 RepID=A0A6A4IV42_9AGAR|nr:hypothetical protein BT96DRAFT_968820 [Gymnopus androsaceus JB14]
MDYYISPSSSDQELDNWGISLQSSYFPVSSARYTPWSTEQFIQASKKRHEPSALQPVPTKRTVESPKESLIHEGLLRENDRLLYTVKHSSVLLALNHARATWTLPNALDSRVRAILALETFLNPFDPVHWLFWSNELAQESAKLVQRHLDRTVYHLFSWSILDWKFRLSGIHSKQLPQILCQKPWYDALVCTTFIQDSPARGPVLRKRKAPSNSRTSSLNDTSEQADEPPAKRSRLLRARPSRKAAADPSLIIPNSESSPDGSITLANDATPATSFLLQPSSSSNAPVLSKRSSSRMMHAASRSVRASSPTSATSSPSALSVALPPPELPHTRSSSRLSARTLVDDVRDSSPSSSTTVADSSTSSTKGKQKAIDEGEADPGVADILLEDDACSVANSFNDEDISLPRLTRSRTGATPSAKNEAVSSVPQRSQVGRKSRANSALSHPSEKLGRIVARSVAATVAEKSVTPDAVTPAPRKGKKTKKSRK